MQQFIHEKRGEIIELCRQHHVTRLAVFGSAVREDFNPETSDVDFLVEFAKQDVLRYAPNFFSLQASLEELLGRKVDLVVASSLRNARMAQLVEEQQQEFYAA